MRKHNLRARMKEIKEGVMYQWCGGCVRGNYHTAGKRYCKMKCNHRRDDISQDKFTPIKVRKCIMRRWENGK